jgi:AcrR family transcriptional regulator
MASETTTEERRGRGRPRAFDPTVALDAALETFRRRGYSGTSLAHLTAATGLNPPSLYATFGNKRALFEAAVDRYWSRTIAYCLPALHESGDLATDLRAFLTRFLDVFTGKGPGGCVIACALPAEADVDRKLRAKLAQMLAQADRAIAARLAEAGPHGNTSARIPADVLGSIVVSVMMAMSLRSRAGASRAELEPLVEGVVELIVPPRRGRVARTPTRRER